MKFSVSIVLIFLMISCSTTNELETEFEKDIVIDLSKASENTLSSLFDSTSYILLEEDN